VLEAWVSANAVRQWRWRRYVVQRRVHTRYGWRIRPIQVCG
jgi:hypothetical protein